MQKISRIYLGNCGYPTAWYDGLTFDLTDPDTALPADVIINLENGGGKTTLLSLIFSCFEPGQDRFLKRLQSGNNHFTQYFSHDGLPGFILAEWLMPPRTTGGPPCTLVVGQVVSIRPGNDVPDCDRLFFSFEARPGLELHDVPAPKLSASPAATMAEFLRWIHEAQRQHPGDVYITRKQADWQRHLHDERLIDLEMLQLQVNFSAQEGGFDTGFLDFRTEAEFLRKFFVLTLDAQRAAAVREAVATTCDKLRRKPQYQRRLAELTRLQGTLGTFGEAASAYQKAMAEQAAVLVDGARMARALHARVADHRQAQQQAQAQAQQLHEAAAAAGEAAHAHSDRAGTLTTLWHRCRVELAQTAQGAARDAHAQAERTILLVKAARLWAEVTAAQARVDALEATAGQAREGLRPFQAQAARRGALLRQALLVQEQALHAQRDEAKGARAARLADIESCRGTLQVALEGLQAAGSKQAGLQAQEDGWRRERHRLLEQEVLASPQETALEALARWQRQAVHWQDERSRLEAEQAAHERRAREAREVSAREGLAAARLEGEIAAQERFIAEGHAEHERLSQLPALLQAVESDVADPESPALPPLLERCAASSAREVASCDVRLAELRATRQAIEDTGVAGHSPDVELVVARLRAAGIRSARPCNGYVADAVPDAGRARALVLSDPARFLGVSVAPAEMERVRAMSWDAALPARPVVVAPVAMDPQGTPADRLVVPASSDAAYHRPAALALAQGLDERMRAEQAHRAAHAGRHAALLAAQEALQAFLRRFGGGRRAAAQVEAERLRHELEMAQARARDAVAGEEEAEQAARQCARRAHERAEDARGCAHHVQELQRLLQDFEHERPRRLQRLEALARAVQTLNEQRAAAAREIAALEAAAREAFEAAVRLGSQAEALQVERDRVEVHDLALLVDGSSLPGAADLPLLRTSYADALQTFRARAQDQLGVLESRLQAAREAWRARADEFTRDFHGLGPDDLGPYAGMDHTALLPGLEQALQRAHEALVDAGAALELANREARQWHHEHPSTLAAVPPDLAALDPEALDRARHEALAMAAQAGQRHEEALAEAEQARQRAADLGRLASEEDRFAALLCSSMALGERPDPELLALQLASLAGAGAGPAPDAGQGFELEADAAAQATRLIDAFQGKVGRREQAHGAARKAFDKLKVAAAEPPLQQVEPELATQLLANGFEAACADAARLLEGLQDRIGTTRSSLEKMQADFDACVEELLALSRTAVSLLNAATTKRVPAGAPYVAGKPVIRMRAHLASASVDARRQALHHYLDHLIDTNVIPARGADLVAEAVLRMHGGKTLGLQLLKMVPDESQQYAALDRITNSGGEGVVMAMFLYLVVAQLRAQTQASLHKAGGGPLILDNPFAKATSPTMWKAQRLLATSIGVQLIFATAIQDYNALGEFTGFIRLRRAGQNSRTQRWHLEAARFKLHEAAADDR
ncbi:coiled-coil domain-containing protein [Azohydromonas lata]|uniref:Chromosome segregation ATPase n=1 Tax=Azohydromonas lata TaxID=45677 RepID=A0ABU5I8Y6_9BURK|nr:hypothetical protein [Azohydromonas lata]MDZ5455304.1 hypothetical protein [Azohydromonas lata]